MCKNKTQCKNEERAHVTQGGSIVERCNSKKWGGFLTGVTAKTDDGNYSV